MSRASATVRPCGRGYVVLSVVAAGLATLAPTFAYNGVLQGLDLVEDLTPETIESMRADMVRGDSWCFYRAADRQSS